MHVHGTGDIVEMYPDMDNVPTEYYEWPLFVCARDCGVTTYSDVVPIMAGVDKLLFCPPPVEVSLVRIQGMGHTWTDGTYPTSQEIVKFFGLTGTSSVELGTEKKEFRVTMNQAGTAVHVELPMSATVQMVTTLGEIVHVAKATTGSLDISCGNLPAGGYLVRILPETGGVALTCSVMVTR
jgi:hypothetical protein